MIRNEKSQRLDQLIDSKEALACESTQESEESLKEKALQTLQTIEELIVKRIGNGDPVAMHELAELELYGIDTGKPVNEIPLDIDKKRNEIMNLDGRIDMGAFTKASPKHAHDNEDCVRIDGEAGIVALADGVGSKKSGHGSFIAANEALKALQNEAIPIMTRIKNTYHSALQAFRRFKKRKENDDINLATTLTYGKIDYKAEKPVLNYGHVGDSRIVIFENNAKSAKTVSGFLEERGILSNDQKQLLAGDDALTDEIRKGSINIPSPIFESLKRMGILDNSHQSEKNEDSRRENRDRRISLSSLRGVLNKRMDAMAFHPKRVTEDSSIPELMRELGVITPEQVKQIDQATDIESLEHARIKISKSKFRKLAKESGIPEGALMQIRIVPDEYKQRGEKDGVSFRDIWKTRNIITAGLSSEEASANQKKKLMTKRFQTGKRELNNGDIVAFMSDGVSDPLTEKEMQEIITREFTENPEITMEELAQKLGERAYERSNGDEAVQRSKRAKPDDISIVLMQVKDIEKKIVADTLKNTNIQEVIQGSNPETREDTIASVLRHLESQGVDTTDYPKESITDLKRYLRSKAELETAYNESARSRATFSAIMSPEDRLLSKMQFNDPKKWRENYGILHEHHFDITKSEAKDPKQFQKYIRDRLASKAKLKNEFIEISGKNCNTTEVKSFIQKLLPDKAKDENYINYRTKKLQKILERADLHKPLGQYTDREREAVKEFYLLSQKPISEKKKWWRSLLGR